MSQFVSTFWKTGLPFGLLMGVFFVFGYGWLLGAVSGVVSGILFGAVFAGFVSYQSSRFAKNRPLMPEENLIKEGGANHFLNGEAVGGWIYLTNSQLFFKSHGANLQNHELTIPLTEIDFVEKANTFGIIPNQFRLTLRDGQVEKFVVNGAEDWVKIVKTLI